MVPIPESSYFPNLESCLNGDELLISWKTVLASLTQSDEQIQSKVHPRLENFLKEPAVLQLLVKPYNPYSFTTTQAKSSFETKTAAINVTPTTKSRYDISEIKEDALWLSKEVQIDEVSALRLVVLEFQTRSAAQLHCNFTEEEAASLQEAGGNGPEALSMVPIATDSSGNLTTFHSQTSRRIRTLRLHLSEGQYLIKCAGIFLQAGLNVKRRTAERSLGDMAQNGPGNILDHEIQWVDSIGNKIFETIQQTYQNMQGFLIYSIKSIKTSFSGLEKGSGWLKEQDGQEDIEIRWLGNKIVEAVHTMEIVFSILEFQNSIPTSESVLEWFRFVATYGFFDEFSSPYPSLQPFVPPLQSLVAIISLVMIDPQRSNEFLNYARDPDSAQEQENSFYISDFETITEIHQILDDAASALSETASPAVLAWSILLAENRRSSTARKDARELRQSIRAVEDFADDPIDDTNTVSGQARLRRSSTGSDISLEPGVLDRLTEFITSEADGDPINRLGVSAVDGCKVFDILTSLSIYFGSFTASTWDTVLGSRIRLAILGLTRLSYGLVDYSPEMVTSSLAALTGGQSFWDISEQASVHIQDEPMANFLQDEWYTDRLLNAAMSRYPYESLPFLKIIHAVASSQTQHDEGTPFAATILESMSTFTFTLPDSFRDYETIQEEDNTNAIQITRPIQLFSPQRKTDLVGRRGFNGKSLTLSRPSEDFSIPAGTQGRIISETGPKVSIFFHQYNGLKYLGKLLETALTASEDIDAITGTTIDRESLAEIIGLLATLLLTCSKIQEADDDVTSSDAAHRILEQASDGLSRNRDIVSVVFSIFEEELHRQSIGDSDSPLDVLVSSLRFIYALVPILPSRVWPLMGRSELLEIEGRGGKISNIVGRVEIATGRYEFLISCTYLFNALVEDSVANAALRKGGSRSVARFGSQEDLGTGVPDQVVSKVLLSFTRIMADVFEGSSTWKFADEEQRLILSGRISSALDNVLQYAYGVGDLSNSKGKLTRSLTASANHIVETFLSTTSGHLRFKPIFWGFLDGFSTPHSTLQPRKVELWLSHVRAVAGFTSTVIRLGPLLERPTSQLENYLFKISPLIARLYAVHETYRIHVVKLLQALVLSAAGRAEEPPSLLGYLGPTTSKSFLHMLLDLDKPLDNDVDVISIWNLMSVVVSNRQQWFSIYILTGRPPRESSVEKTSGEQPPPPKTLLKVALERLSGIKTLSGPIALAMLEFVSLAQNFWPWVMGDLQKQSKFIQSISEHVSELGPNVTSNVAKSLESCYNSRVAAYVAEILAMYLYHSRQLGNTTAANELIAKSKYYMNYGITPSTYNKSLHSNLKRNFETKFTGCSLEDFKKTELEPRDFGREYLYDVKFGDKMLHSDQAWNGRRNDGLAEELAIANVNLSLVEAQTALLHGWRLLALELSTGLSNNLELQRNAATTIKKCLEANEDGTQYPENIFVRQNQTRAEFALLLMQRLIDCKSSIPEVLGLLPVIWKSIVDHGSSFESALLSGGMPYYRILLKLLFLSLSTHAGKESAPAKPKGDPSIPHNSEEMLRLSSPTVRLAITVINDIVAKGFRDLVTAVHEKATDLLPADVALITAILQSCLRIPGVELCHTQILSLMAANDAPRVATTLFSWSDKLAIDGDPLYGELAILFLLTLSSMPQVAEQLAVEGVLGHLSSATITDYIRRANVSPFADSRGAQRCYSIWVRGLLPLLLNILSAVGATVAAEIAIFLNQFPNLLSASADSLDVPQLGMSINQTKPIVLANVSEVHSLALITFALARFREQLMGVTVVPDVTWDTAGVLESVEHWLTTRISLRERILPMTPRETEMRRQKPGKSADGQFETRLEEEVVGELIGIRDVLTGGDGE